MLENSEKYHYNWDEEDKNVSTMAIEILEDAKKKELTKIHIGCWNEAFDESCQPILDMICDNSIYFQKLEVLIVGDMSFEDCELSWIVQGDYSKLYESVPSLKKLVIHGATELVLGKIKHHNLEELVIVSGGLESKTIESIKNAQLPNLRKLELYLGVGDYGFDGDINTIKSLVTKMNFPLLTSLGLVNSEIEKDIAQWIVEQDIIKQLTVLDLSKGTLIDKDAPIFILNKNKLEHLVKLDLSENYFDENKKLLENSFSNIDLSEQREIEEYDDETYIYPVLTE